MEYLISKGKKVNLILSSSYLIIYYLVVGLSFLFKDIRKLDSIENGLTILFFAVALGYIYLIFIDYFKFYNLNALKVVSLIVLISEISNQGFLLINSFSPIIPGIISTIFNIVSVIGMITWIVLLFRLKERKYSAFDSLRKFAFGQITAVILGIFIGIVTMFGGFFDYEDLMYLPLAIPFIFTIDFANKLNIK